MSDWKERQRSEARAAIDRGREALRYDWETLRGERLIDVWRAAVAHAYGDEIAVASLTRFSGGWYTARAASRFPDGSVGAPGGLDRFPSMRRDAFVAEIARLLSA